MVIASTLLSSDQAAASPMMNGTTPLRGRNTANGKMRRRAYSWRGESPPYDRRKLQQTNLMDVNPSELLPLISQESRCVSAWVVTATSIQVIVSILIRVASYAYPVTSASSPRASHNWLWDGLAVGPSVIAGVLLRLVPPQVITQEAPGFIYASAWILLAIKDRMGGVVPHVPTRICEAALGRLSVMECLILVAVQFACTASTVTVIRYCFLSKFDDGLALYMPEYTSRAVGDGHPWIVDYFHEMLVTTLFTVALQVVPVLLKLNRGPVWLALLFVYPLYTYGVDSGGHGSTLSPSILLALSSSSSFYQMGRCLPQMLGGLLAGRIMCSYFPDDDKRA
ncbi:expressed unknown protein [Seminavis robusta]|uniref:Uncharacterized protein n=1 Tax=Seminavis robusta TaxID=568900 RepID=A0A9N8EV86_9STRA|nr:expressed unknown protein [Seminavis robusta]CAB9527328.1 expressed unknown protein [Seminavis robusta]|eukprot:Sro1977_g308980.1 n/a (338) ;mRNA; r:18318-19575